MPKNHRVAAAFLVIATLLFAPPAYATSITEYNAMPAKKRSALVVDFIEKMTADIGRNNPQLMQVIRDWFSRTPEGKRFPEGLMNLAAELMALEDLAKEGKVDLSRIQIEGVIVKVVKDKFPPPK